VLVDVDKKGQSLMDVTDLDDLLTIILLQVVLRKDRELRDQAIHIGKVEEHLMVMDILEYGNQIIHFVTKKAMCLNTG
jgi:hypothetical protein